MTSQHWRTFTSCITSWAKGGRRDITPSMVQRPPIKKHLDGGGNVLLNLYNLWVIELISPESLEKCITFVAHTNTWHRTYGWWVAVLRSGEFVGGNNVIRRYVCISEVTTGQKDLEQIDPVCTYSRCRLVLESSSCCPGQCSVVIWLLLAGGSANPTVRRL